VAGDGHLLPLTQPAFLVVGEVVVVVLGELVVVVEVGPGLLDVAVSVVSQGRGGRGAETLLGVAGPVVAEGVRESEVRLGGLLAGRAAVQVGVAPAAAPPPLLVVVGAEPLHVPTARGVPDLPNPRLRVVDQDRVQDRTGGGSRRLIRV